jgi:thiamine pyrophosphate-dependent acetolactate synthase large subunit-like protein
MSIVEKGLTTSGVEIDERNYPVDNPSKRKFAKVIKALREAESQASDEIRNKDRRYVEMAAEKDEWMKRALEAESRLREYAMREVASECDLNIANTQRLIAAAS